MICGYLLATGPLCHVDQSGPGRYCTPHETRSTCSGCGQRASRECPAFVGASRCAESLCPDCAHKEFGAHGAVVSATDSVRQGLIATVELSLKDAARQGLIAFPPAGRTQQAAALIVDHMTAHTMLQVLSGMANPK